MLVADGRAVLPIVVTGSRREREAAADLQRVIAAMTGVRIEVTTNAAVGAAVFVGDGQPADMAHPDRFRVSFDAGSIRFSGRADYAVYDFAERVLGARCYWNDERGGLWTPKTEGLAVVPVEYEDEPVYEYRNGGERVKALWKRFAKAGNSHYGRLKVHAPHRWRRDAEVPREIFAQGVSTNSPMLCYGNPATLSFYERRIDEHIAGVRDSGGIVDSERKIVTVSPWDEEYRCRCRWCRTLRSHTAGPTGDASPIVWGYFLKRLAEWLAANHRDYRIEFLPYWNYVLPPAAGLGGGEFELPGNCEAYVCTVPGMAYLKYEPRRRTEVETLRRWQAITGRKVLNWDYACWPCESTSSPYVYGHTAQRQCAELAEVSAGTFICGTKEVARQCVSLYVWQRALWNPALDVEAVYEGLCERMFGRAAATMLELIRVQERAWNPPDYDFSADAIEAICSLLRQAEAEVAGDAEAEERFGYYLSGFERFFHDQGLPFEAETVGKSTNR